MTLDEFIRQVQEKLVKSETYTEHGKECDLETAIAALEIATKALIKQRDRIRYSEFTAQEKSRKALAEIEKLLETSGK